MAGNLPLFGAAHCAILGIVVSTAVALTMIQKRLEAGSSLLRIALGAVLVADTILYYIHMALHGSLSFPNHLPLELCDASLFLTILVLFTRNQLAFELAYYWGLAGATMALLTPNLLEPFPSVGAVQFFVVHGLIVASMIYLPWSGLLRPGTRSVWRAIVGVDIFALLVGTFDAIFHSNYMYLRSKPVNASLLDVLGPWPWYLLTTEGVALAMFGLLYLPFWRGNAKPVEAAAD